MKTGMEYRNHLRGFVAPRAVAKKIGNIGVEEVIDRLDASCLGADELKDQFVSIFGALVTPTIRDIVNKNKSKLRGDDHRYDEDVFYASIKRMTHDPIPSGVHDAMGATLSIPRVPRAQALSIALSPQSRASVRLYGRTSEERPMQLPILTPSGPKLTDRRLAYDLSTDAIVTTVGPSGEGCPLAKARGELMENFYALVAEVTIREVELTPGEKYFPVSVE
jgi:hypothetical protein